MPCCAVPCCVLLLMLSTRCAAQIAAYMNEVRQSRLERVTNKQDDEIVGIVGLYLSITMGILALAALANLAA